MSHGRLIMVPARHMMSVSGAKHVGQTVYMQCLRKEAYRSKKDAMRVVRKISSTGSDKNQDPTKRLSVYKCPHCEQWHVGHSIRKEFWRGNNAAS